MNESVFVGIDVSKDKLDISACPKQMDWSIPNDEIRVRELTTKLKSLKPTLIVMEAMSTSLQNSPLSTVEFSPVCEQKNRVIRPSF